MEHQLLIGKFTLESLTSGLYVSPLDLYREYVQNAADSIDEALEQGILKKGEEKISITVSESERIIKISDNGTGVGANDIYSNLIDIGNSKKRHSNSRGFRGIGRLSGLGYCQKLKFVTSIHGEEKASCITYDAEKLKYLLSPQVDSRDSIDQVLSSVLTIEEIPERINEHYFSVELYGVVPESDLSLMKISFRIQDEMTMKKIVPIKNCLVSSRNGLMKCQGRYVTDLTKEV